MRRFMYALSLASILLTSQNVFAQSDDPILSLPEGQVILNISATERQEVEQDLLIATLSVSETRREASVVQDTLNSLMSKALDKAKKVKDIKVSTGQYRVNETTDARTREKQWRGQQSVTLKSLNSSALLELAGDLQEMGLKMDSLDYTLSPETAIKIQDEMMEAALEQLQARATRAAKALGKSKAELRDVNVQASNVPYHQIQRSYAAPMAEMSSSMAAPVAAAGESTLSLSVNARAIIKP